MNTTNNAVLKEKDDIELKQESKMICGYKVTVSYGDKSMVECVKNIIDLYKANGKL